MTAGVEADVLGAGEPLPCASEVGVSEAGALEAGALEGDANVDAGGATGRASFTLLLVNSRQGWNSAAPTMTRTTIATPTMLARILWARIIRPILFMLQG